MRSNTMRVPAVIVAVLATAGCHGSIHAAPAAPPPATSSYAPVHSAPPGSPAALLDQMVVAEEDTGAHYNRDEWGEDWAYHAGGCNTRELVLIAQGFGVQKGKGCTPVCPTHRQRGAELEPCWTSPYDGRPTHDASELEIDHRVAPAEAARSRVVGSGPAGEPALGAARVWNPQEKNRFYEDLDNLAAVTDTVNSSKNDRDPGRWTPSLESARCDFAIDYAKTKLKWRLSVDPAEMDGLRQMITFCPQPSAAAELGP